MLADTLKPTHADAAAWTYASGLVSALEGRLLALGATRDLLATTPLDDLVPRLRQTLLFGDLADRADPFGLAEAMDACATSFVAFFTAACPLTAVADLFQRPTEWRAFRAYLRVQILEAEPRPVADSFVPDEVWQQCWTGSDVEPEYALFAKAAEAIHPAIPRESHDQRLVDEITAIHEIRDLARIARGSCSAAIAAWVTTWLKLQLALALLRCRRNGWGHVRTADALDDFGVSKQDIMALVAPEHRDWRTVLVGLGLRAAEGVAESAPLSVVERLIDDELTEAVKAAHGTPFGPEPVFGFLWGARIEALNLRLVAAGRAAGLPSDAIAEDLRQTYV